MKQDIVIERLMNLIREKAEGMNLTTLSVASGVSEKAIKKALYGETNPHFTTLNKLLRALSITDEEIKDATNGE